MSSRAWEGLGYYRRARQLQAAARMIVERHGGVMPRDRDLVRELPGVGRYIAGAILSFAFDLPEPIVEANSQRVLARLLAWPEDLKTSSTPGPTLESRRAAGSPHGAGDVQPGTHGPGSPDLYTAVAELPDLPGCIIAVMARRRGFKTPCPW